MAETWWLMGEYLHHECAHADSNYDSLGTFPGASANTASGTPLSSSANTASGAPLRESAYASDGAVYELRPMQLFDLRAVMGIEMLAFSQPWSALAFRCELLDNPLCDYYVLEELRSTKIVGYAGLWYQDGFGSITKIAVDPHLRQQGLGTRLLKHIVASANKRGLRQLTLEFRAGNVAARAFYTKHGFSLLDIIKDYYQNPNEDAILMALSIHNI
ncbi:MAG: ribosomal protein S18-alanine N-acetyltransferase [Coriobacteriales bacterium]|jgi:ribosomal-protein-alanine N-acetyltransferase|nr:ribosomal protein S18-alanine N-acetyltransferase [Coriobacteriales bacterium]